MEAIATKEFLGTFGAFAFGLAVLVWFIKHLKDQLSERDGKIKELELLIGKKEDTIVSLQKDYLNTSSERVRLSAEGQILVAKAIEAQSNSTTRLTEKIEDALHEMLRGKVA